MKDGFQQAIRKEIRVMFHKHSQKPGVRIVKYMVLSIVIFVFWHSPLFWWILAGVVLAAVLLHTFYRYKTRAWTRSYGKGLFRWDHEKVMGSRRKPM